MLLKQSQTNQQMLRVACARLNIGCTDIQIALPYIELDCTGVVEDNRQLQFLHIVRIVSTC